MMKHEMYFILPRPASRAILAVAVYSRQARKVQLFVSVADLAALLAAFAAAYAVRRHLPLSRYFEIQPPVLALLQLAAFLSWLLSGIWFRLYDQIQIQGWAALLSRTLRQALAMGLSVVVLEFLLRLDLSRPFLAFFVLFAALVAYSFRALLFLLHGRRPGFASEPFQVLIAGAGETALSLARHVEAARPAFRILGFLGEAPGRVQLSASYPVFPVEEFPQLLHRHVVDEVIFATDAGHLAQLEAVFLFCEEEGVRTRLSLELFPHVHSRVYLDTLGGEPLLTFSSAPYDEIRLLIKRLTDIALAATALSVLLPFLVVIGFAIRLSSPGPALFGQRRCGLNGRRFTCWKFRTMAADAEARQAEVAHLNVKRTAFKIPNDPRVTPLGWWLRKFSIDEFPQLWNVLRGEMAIVGPRPAVPAEVEQYEGWQRRRLRMRPGLTCLWTLAGRDALDFDEWMRLDLAYLDNWSLSLDWSIILRTIPHVVSGKGAN
jgi:exopolysaccharide biosynthesis polyprenyl glycosylphosphotransferase